MTLVGRPIAVLVLALSFSASPAAAQPYPSKPIRMIVPFVAGGAADYVGRLMAAAIHDRTGQTVVVENRPGAGGALGMDYVAKAAPDGYTLGSANTGDFISKFLRPDQSFDPLTDLTPVAMIGHAPQLLVIGSTLPAKTFQEFIAYARARPGKINYGSPGVGSLSHIGAEYLAKLAGLKLVHVPYRGAIPAVADMIAGRIQMMHISLNPIIGQIRAGKLRPLVVAAKERWSDYLPDVPSSAELGMPDYEMDIWFGLVAPHGTPKPIVDQLNGYMRDMVADPAMRKRIAAGFMEPESMPADAFADYVRQGTAHWGKIVTDLHIKAE
jgi:tripartite-type tricarboxylate transporter receptor subunit TctC